MADDKQMTVNGAQLGRALAGALKAHAGEDGTPGVMLNRLAVAAGIDKSKVQELVDGKMDFAPRTWLNIFAAVLDIDLWDLIMAASNDNSDARYSNNDGTQKNNSKGSGAHVSISHNENESGTCEPCRKSLTTKVLEVLRSLGLKGAENAAQGEIKEEKETMAEKINQDAKKGQVDALIASDKTQFAENNREWLMGLSDEQLALLEPKAEEKAQEDAKTTVNVEKVVEKVVEKPVVMTKVQILETLGMTEEDLAAARAINEQRKQTRNSTISQIKALEGCPYTDVELSTMSDSVLEKTLDTLQPSSFRTAPGVRHQNNDDNKVPASPKILLATPTKQEGK